MDLSKETIFLACGGTGGHIFPAFSLAEELARRFPGIRVRFLCGTKDIEEAIFKPVPREDLRVIQSAPFRGVTSLLNPAFLIKLTKGFLQARRLLRQEKPALVIGFGGYFAFPVVLMARWLGIKTMVHEQNVVPGFANKILSRAVDAVALSHEQTQGRLKGWRLCRVTGNPIRSFLERDCRREALEFFGFAKDKVTVLILGGSQGSQSINTLFLAAIKFLPEAVKKNIQVIHLCGRMDPAEAQKACLERGVGARAYSFFERMDLAYGAADFAVGRAGATFLAEIKAKDIPAILVPYPYAGAHQLENARVFCQAGDSITVEQKDLDAIKLGRLLETYIGRCRSGRSNASLVAPKEQSGRVVTGADIPGPINARTKLADFVEECVLF